MKTKRKISGKAIIIIIIFLAILAARKGSYIQSNFIEKNNGKDTELKANPSSRSEKKLSDSSLFFSPQSWEDCQVIVENNLFRPLGWEKEVVKKIALPEPIVVEMPRVAKIPREQPAPTYNNLVLTGIAQNGSEWVAILEDQARKEGHFLHRGEQLKDSLVSEIFPEHIILAQGNTKAQLSLGENIQYDTNEQILFDSIKNYQDSMPTDQKVGEDEYVQKSLIERLKARRRKELNQK